MTAVTGISTGRHLEMLLHHPAGSGSRGDGVERYGAKLKQVTVGHYLIPKKTGRRALNAKPERRDAPSVTAIAEPPGSQTGGMGEVREHEGDVNSIGVRVK